MVDDTKMRILEAALRAFSNEGYHQTSVQTIAKHVGVTKAAVLYHFPSKVDILSALATPMLDALDTALDGAEIAAGANVRTATIEGVLDVFLAHRYLIRMNLRDLAFVSGPFFGRYRDALLRANAIFAGKKPTFSDRVLAAQALSLLADPVVLYADAPTDELRAAVLAGARRLLRAPAVKDSVAVRRGRPGIVDAGQAERARRSYLAGVSPTQIAKKLGVSRATIYRYLRRR
jgi:AcrR family transcriptional regulator